MCRPQSVTGALHSRDDGCTGGDRAVLLHALAGRSELPRGRDIQTDIRVFAVDGHK